MAAFPLHRSTLSGNPTKCPLVTDPVADARININRVSSSPAASSLCMRLHVSTVGGTTAQLPPGRMRVARTLVAVPRAAAPPAAACVRLPRKVNVYIRSDTRAMTQPELEQGVSTPCELGHSGTACSISAPAVGASVLSGHLNPANLPSGSHQCRASARSLLLHRRRSRGSLEAATPARLLGATKSCLGCHGAAPSC